MKSIFQNKTIRSSTAIFCCLLWGSAFPSVKIGYRWFNISTPSSQILFSGYRFFLAGILTFFIGCLIEKRILTMKKSSVPYIVRQGLLQTTLQYAFFYIGMANTTGTKGSVINATNAFVSIIAAHFFISSEKMTWKKTIGCIVGFLGVVIINLQPQSSSHSFSFWGEGMIFLCAIAYGLSSVILKLISNKESVMTITAYQLLIGGGVLILIGWIAGGHIAQPSGKALLLLLYMASLSTVAFSLWTTLLKYNPVGEVAIFGFSIPVFGVMLSALFLNEQILLPKNFIALFFVSMGIFIVNSKTNRDSISVPD